MAFGLRMKDGRVKGRAHGKGWPRKGLHAYHSVFTNVGKLMVSTDVNVAACEWCQRQCWVANTVPC